MTVPHTPPDAIMLLGTHCPHCPGVLKQLTDLVKSGELGRLQITNMEQHPEEARSLGARSVPWVKIGTYVLTGAQDIEAFRQRIQWSARDSSRAGEFDFLLSNGKVSKVIEQLQRDNSAISVILELLGDPATVLSTRIGIGVIMEEFAATPLLQQQIPALTQLTEHNDPRIRADALHYLGLTQSKQAIPVVQHRLDDEDAEVREVAAESLQALSTAQTLEDNHDG